MTGTLMKDCSEKELTFESIELLKSFSYSLQI